jgi:uncharacterized protein YprB with RNaseH-like and TPR domain
MGEEKVREFDLVTQSLCAQWETGELGSTPFFEARFPHDDLLPRESFGSRGDCDRLPTTLAVSNWSANVGRRPEFASDGMADVLNLARMVERSVSTAAFLDVETTGLNMGAGTLVIIVGLGFADGSEFVVRQYFLHDPAAEPAFLTTIASVVSRFDCIVTFNGKRFDVPMLLGRFHLHRFRDPIPPNHIDILHPARRIWRQRLGRSNLGTLEERILGVVREVDVPGYEIPARYFAFLQHRGADLMRPVLDHNRQDVISMARLATVIGLLLRDDSVARRSSPSDLLGLGSLLETAGRGEHAALRYEAALVGASPVERAEALLRLAKLAQKAKELDRAIQLFDAVSTYSTRRAASAAIDLAKIYEHHLREPEQALRYARRALDILTRERVGDADWAVQDTVRRVKRLEAKVTLNKRAAPFRTG